MTTLPPCHGDTIYCCFIQAMPSFSSLPIPMEKRNDDVIAAMKHKLEESFSLPGHPTPHTNMLDYEVLAFIGRGSFGQVRLVRTKSSCGAGDGHRLFALKNISKDAMNSKPRERIHAERDVLERAKSTAARDWLVDIHQAFQVPGEIDNIYTVTCGRTKRICICSWSSCPVGISATLSKNTAPWTNRPLNSSCKSRRFHGDCFASWI